MPCPVAPAESDTLSGRARRGLDRALAVGGGMHRVGACRGGGGGTGQPCVSYTQLAGGQGAGPGGGTGGRRSPAGRRAQVCAGVIGFLFPRSGVFESASIAGWGRMHYTPPIPQGIRAWQPGDRRRAEAAPIVGTRLFRLRSTLHALWRAVWGLPQGGAGPCPVDQPRTVCRLSLGRGRGQVFNLFARSHHGYNPGESHLPPHS